MASLALAVLAIFILSHASRAQRAGTGTAEELLDKNAFQQSRPLLSVTNPLAQNRRNSKSMSFIDYFFPPSRQAKVSKNFKSSKQITEQPPTTLTEKISEPTTPTKSYDEIIQTTPVTEGAFSVTLEEGRATGSTKKGTTGKRRNSQTRTTAIPKQKTSQKNTQSTHSSSSTHVTQSVKSTQKSTTSKPVTKQDTTYANTMTTHKHYTIYPNVMSKTNPPTSLYHTKRPDTTVAQGSTGSQAHRVTLAELAKVTENKPSGALPAAAAESTTESRQREGELELREKPSKQPAKVTVENKNESVALPDGSTVLVKPTKYHYYPHNQHIYLLPECAIQQVCNAVYVRLNYTQPLCACPSRHRDPCSASLNADDLHTTQLTTDSKKKYASKAVTLVKTCEATSEMRECRSPRDWSLLALQNIRTGKSHYLVICRCPEENVLEGPMAHDQPTYASVPGIRVYGMMCVQQTQFSSQGYGVSSRPPMSSYKVGYSQPNYSQDQYTGYPDYVGPGVYYGRSARNEREIRSGKRRIQLPPIPWDKVKELADTANWEN